MQYIGPPSYGPAVSKDDAPRKSSCAHAAWSRRPSHNEDCRLIKQDALCKTKVGVRDRHISTMLSGKGGSDVVDLYKRLKICSQPAELQG